MVITFIRSGIVAALPVLILLLAGAPSAWADINIVAVGASNTLGLGVRASEAYPAVLQGMLRQRGIKARVHNSGVILDTTARMLRRLDHSVPEGTDIVILQPGGNDLRFYVTKEQRAANIQAMVKRLHQRKIKVIVFDPVIPPQYYQNDGIHISPAGHAMFASRLLPQVLSAIGARSAAVQ